MTHYSFHNHTLWGAHRNKSDWALPLRDLWSSEEVRCMANSTYYKMYWRQNWNRKKGFLEEVAVVLKRFTSQRKLYCTDLQYLIYFFW